MPRPRKPAKRARNAVITQAQLAEYKRLMAEVKTATTAQELARKSLMARLDKGAKVESGPIRAYIDTQDCVYFTAEAVAAVVTVEVAAAIKSLIPTTATRKLIVSGPANHVHDPEAES